VYVKKEAHRESEKQGRVASYNSLNLRKLKRKKEEGKKNTQGRRRTGNREALAKKELLLLLLSLIACVSVSVLARAKSPVQGC